MSLFISDRALSCAAVNLNGSIFAKLSAIFETVLNAIPFCFSVFPFFKARPISRQKSSSKTRLLCGSQFRKLKSPPPPPFFFSGGGGGGGGGGVACGASRLLKK